MVLIHEYFKNNALACPYRLPLYQRPAMENKNYGKR